MMMTDTARTDRPTPDIDVVVVGAGIAGLYLAYRLSRAGYRLRVFEAADDVGGTWYWNRYPGARVDVPSVDYMFSFDPDWQRDWQWSEKYATQPEILRYLNHVADKHDLRRHITFSTRVQQARWADDASLWHVSTDLGAGVTSRFVVMATGCLSMPKQAEVDGLERFAGEVYFTSCWPHDPVDFTGKRVAVIGTGSSGVQAIPVIAQEAQQLVVFQRTPNFSIPARNGPLSPEKLAQLANESEYRAAARVSPGGIPMERSITPTFSVSETERQQRYERAWEGGLLFDAINVYADVLSNPAANHEFAEFFRNKIRSIVDDPETAADLCPTDHPIATKRPCLDTNYYATYNLPHVRLVNVRKHPIQQVTETGIDTADESFTVDAIVFATGFDAVTGAITAVDIRGRNDLALKDKWANGPQTYLGLTTAGFPNLFFITGPGSPSVLSNMVVSIEQHADWVLDCLDHLSAGGFDVIEPTEMAEAGWTQHVNDCADITLYPAANSWYMGANVPGKPRVFLPYCAGLDFYRLSCDEVVARDYLGFRLSGPNGSQCNDGVVRRLQPDVEMVLNAVAALNLPPMESMAVADARGFTRRCRRLDRRDQTSARSSTVSCPAPPAIWCIGCTGRRPPARTRSSCTSMAAVKCWVTPSRMIRCAGTFVCGATRSSSRRTTATRPSTDSPRRSMTPWPRCSGWPTTPRRWEADRDSSRCVAGVRAVGLRRWYAGWPGTWVDRTSWGRRC